MPASAAARTDDDSDHRLAFERVHALYARSVLAFAVRRTRTAEDAEDAAAETFIVAWRRRDRLPPPDVALPWLFAVARRVIANQRRGTDRRTRLQQRIAERAPGDEPIVLGTPETSALLALAQLSADDQELLKLVAWEGLRNADIAEVLGITPNAVAIRLHRARRRYERALAEQALAEPEAKGSTGSRTLTALRSRLFGSAGRNEAR